MHYFEGNPLKLPYICIDPPGQLNDPLNQVKHEKKENWSRKNSKYLQYLQRQKNKKKQAQGWKEQKKMSFSGFVIRLEKVTHLTLMPAAGMSIKM